MPQTSPHCQNLIFSKVNIISTETVHKIIIFRVMRQSHQMPQFVNQSVKDGIANIVFNHTNSVGGCAFCIIVIGRVILFILSNPKRIKDRGLIPPRCDNIPNILRQNDTF